MREIKQKEIDAITAEQYAQAFRGLGDRMPSNLLEAHLAAPNYTITWQDLAEAVGMASYRAVNARYGKLAHEVAELLGFVEPPEDFWLFALVRLGEHARFKRTHRVCLTQAGNRSTSNTSLNFTVSLDMSKFLLRSAVLIAPKPPAPPKISSSTGRTTASTNQQE